MRRARRPTRASAAALLAPLLAATLAACSDPEPPAGPRPNLLLIIVDTLRPDRLGAWGHTRDTSPAIDGLAADGVRFERAYTTAPWTKPAVASILTGRYPRNHGVTAIRSVLPEPATTLAEVLADAGYRTASVTSNGLLRAGSGFEQGYEVYDDAEALGADHLSTPGVTGRALGLLEEYAAGPDPFFLTLLYFDPHYRYVPHADVDFAAPSVGRLDGSESIQELRALDPPPTAAEVEFLLDVYDEEIAFTDRGIGRVLARLAELDLADDTLVVLTADHGEEFLEHGWLGHTRNLYEGLLRVPLIVRAPGRTPAGRVVERPVSLVSLAATLVELAGLDPAAHDFQGPSLAALLAPDGRPDPAALDGSLFFEVDYVPLGRFDAEKRARMRGLVAGELKLIRDETARAYELYDLGRDPLERRRLEAERPDLLRGLAEQLQLRTRAAEGDERAARELREVGEEERELLRRLGYLDD